MQPDKPQLCRFWLTGLVSALRDAAARKLVANAMHPLTTLLHFLWRYTWAAVPQPLRSPLLAAINGIAKLMKCRVSVLPVSRCDAASYTPPALATLTWVMQHDPVFRCWHLDGPGRGEAFPALYTGSSLEDGAPLTGGAPLVMRRAPSLLRAFRSQPFVVRELPLCGTTRRRGTKGRHSNPGWSAGVGVLEFGF